jgi:hypothetical protein
MPTAKPKARYEFTPAIHPARSEPTQVFPLPALTSAAKELDLLRKDHQRTISEQLAVESDGRSASAELLGSRLILERRIAAAERGLVALHREQANAAFESERPTWEDLQRSRALCVIALRRINREIAELKSSFRSGGVDAELVLGDDVIGYQLLGLSVAKPGRTGLAARQFLVQCERAGIISKLELSEDE